MYSIEDGRLAIRIARDSVERRVRGQPRGEYDVPDIFLNRSGVFVTLNTYPAHELRGCIGYPEPILPLNEAIVQAAESAAIEDPRFPPVRENELDSIVVEVSLLTPPELIEVKNPKEYLKEVEIGRDGLIVSNYARRGLLLPQVPVEWEWDVQQFLEHTCMKAGLTPDMWLDNDTKIYRFTGEIFAEREPHGEVVEKKLSACE